MSIATYGWLVLLCPLVGTMLIGLTCSALPRRVHGMIGTRRSAARSCARSACS